MNFPPDETIHPQPWLLVPRQHDIRIVLIHSTRGPGRPQEEQYGATKNWLLSPSNNRGGWGASTNRIISHEGQMCIACPDDMQPTWSCGFGFQNSWWAVDWYAVSFELAQSDLWEPFRPETLERAAIETAKLCSKYNIPPAWLDRVDQTGAVPTGITGHDRTDNGRVYGKTDPGDLFEVDAFIARVNQLLQAPGGPGEPPPPATTPLAVHDVRSGENLWRIAQAYYGDGNRWPLIYDANKAAIGPNPSLIRVGMLLTIPRP